MQKKWVLQYLMLFSGLCVVCPGMGQTFRYQSNEGVFFGNYLSYMGVFDTETCSYENQSIWIDYMGDCSFVTYGEIYTFRRCFSCAEDGNDFLAKLVVGSFFGADSVVIPVDFYPQFIDTVTWALTCDYANHLYLAGEGLSVFDPLTEQFSLLGYLPPGMQAGGAMTYRDGRLLLTTVSHTLVELNQSDPMASQTLYAFPDTVPPIHAMVSFPYRCDSIVTFAIGTDTSGSRIYRLDVDSYALTEVCQTDLHIYGAAAREACWRPPCELQAILDEDGSSLAAASGDYRDTLCRTPAPIADTDLRINAVLELDSIELVLDGILDAGAEYLDLIAVPPVPYSGAGTPRLVLYNPGGAAATDFEQALALVRYHNTAPVPASGERQVHVLPRSGIYSGFFTHAYLYVDSTALQVQISSANPACFGDNGAVQLAAYGTEAPYVYVWFDGQMSPQRSDLPAGEHFFTVSDALGCSRTLSAVLSQPDSLILSLSGDTFACGNSGSLSGVGVGGVPPYTYAWSNGDNGPQADQLGGGTHSLTLTDAQGCTAIAQAELEQLDTVFTHEQVQRCAGEAYDFQGQSYYADTTLCVSYAALSGCDSVHCITVQFLDTFRMVQQARICEGQTYYFFGLPLNQDTTMCLHLNTLAGCDSVICVNLEVVPRHYPQTVSLCEGETYTFGGQLLSQPGWYADTLSSATGCDSIVLLQLEVLPLPQIQWSTQGSLCRGEPVSLSPGNHQTYQWSDGSTGAGLQVNQGGVYAVTVTGAGACMAQGSISLSDSALTLSAGSTPARCYGYADGRIRVAEPIGGVSPYRYRLPGRGGWQSSPDFEGLSAGNYTIEAEDASGCRGSLEAVVSQPDELLLYAGEDHRLKLGAQLNLYPQTNARAIAGAQWSPPGGLSCDTCVQTQAQPLQSTLYTLSLTDTAGCRVQDAVWILIERGAGVFVPNALSPNADGINDALVIYADASVGSMDRLRIFDRWGALVAEIPDPQPGANLWDAKSRGGRPVQAGVYVYVLELTRIDGQQEQVSGELTVLR